MKILLGKGVVFGQAELDDWIKLVADAIHETDETEPLQKASNDKADNTGAKPTIITVGMLEFQERLREFLNSDIPVQVTRGPGPQLIGVYIPLLRHQKFTMRELRATLKLLGR